ncbi:hypothetical protein PybrP1_005365 [[Pythium] brassicae (nom. inval.)]|nr:hypothetical protein PybrP1_005365 [[Pythium] brassicae (nom. inval.)]
MIASFGPIHSSASQTTTVLYVLQSQAQATKQATRSGGGGCCGVSILKSGYQVPHCPGAQHRRSCEREPSRPHHTARQRRSRRTRDTAEANSSAKTVAAQGCGTSGGELPGCLHLEATRFSATTSHLELAALRAHVRLDVVVRVHRVDRRLVAEVAVHLARRAAATQEYRVRTLRRAERQLVEAEALAAGVRDARARRLRERQSDHRDLRHVQEADVVRHRAHDHCELALVARHVAGDAADRHRRLVRVRLIQAAQHDAVELGVRATSQEAVQLQRSRDTSNSDVSTLPYSLNEARRWTPPPPLRQHRLTYANEQVQVHILRLRRGAVLLTNDLAAGDEIDTLESTQDTHERLEG